MDVAVSAAPRPLQRRLGGDVNAGLDQRGDRGATLGLGLARVTTHWC